LRAGYPDRGFSVLLHTFPIHYLQNMISFDATQPRKLRKVY